MAKRKSSGLMDIVSLKDVYTIFEAY